MLRQGTGTRSSYPGNPWCRKGFGLDRGIGKLDFVGLLGVLLYTLPENDASPLSVRQAAEGFLHRRPVPEPSTEEDAKQQDLSIPEALDLPMLASASAFSAFRRMQSQPLTGFHAAECDHVVLVPEKH